MSANAAQIDMVTKVARRDGRVFGASSVIAIFTNSKTGTISRFSLFTTIAKSEVNVRASQVTTIADHEPPMEGLSKCIHISTHAITSMLETGSAYVLPPWTAKAGVTEKISAPASPEIPLGSSSLPTKKTNTTVSNDEARLMELAVLKPYPKTFAATAIMNG